MEAFGRCSRLEIVNVYPTTPIHPDIFFDCTTLNNLAQNSVRNYIRSQFKIKQDKIDLRVAVFMLTNSKIRYELNVPPPQVVSGNRELRRKRRRRRNGRRKSSELNGVLALSMLNDDVWREIVEFL